MEVGHVRGELEGKNRTRQKRKGRNKLLGKEQDGVNKRTYGKETRYKINLVGRAIACV